MIGHVTDRRDESDRPPDALDPLDDRDELKSRYYNLVHELRVLLPGVQVLVAFLLTVPFASHFDQLDRTGQAIFGVSLVSGSVSVVVLMTPIALHRFGDRRDRVERLQLSIQLTRLGLVTFGISLVAAVLVVVSFVFATVVSVVVMALVVLPIAILWVALPLSTRCDGPR